MKLEELDAQTLTRAATIFCNLAYEAEEAVRQLQRTVPKPKAPFAEVLSWFADESDQAESAAHRRYALRMGNRNYPCMKMVLEEILYPSEFFFYVDTHDDVDLDPDTPEYEAWQELRAYNRELKSRIEAAWWNAGIATIRDLKDLLSERANPEHNPDRAGAEGRGPKARAGDADDAVQRQIVVMVVDDDRDMADTTALALETQGYRTVEVFDPAGVVREARRVDPDAILVDSAVGGCSGREICRRLRNDAKTARIPLALVAPRLDFFRKVPEADACLFKPYDVGVLYRIVDRLVARSLRSSPES